ncbi:MAG: DEAD/DEAH box helicase family protein [Saprospiraceae bacterium]
MANFHDKLVLNKYLLSLFGIDSIGHKIVNKEGVQIFKELKYSINEGYTEEGNTIFLQTLLNHQYPTEFLTREMLQEYDENIVRFTKEISANRNETIQWKYFQYLSLLFTEIYLDKYFANKTKLLAELNEYAKEYNAKQLELGRERGTRANQIFQIELFQLKDLNKLAFWNATGSGKTLLMHINIKQYFYYLQKHNQQHQNKILLITPNEGLSKQHLDEFALSKIQATIFSKNTSAMFTGKEVEILEITKLAAESGDKTVAVDSFETDNLVLIDEGHRGTSGDSWKNYRDQLSQTGFAFEYSATFGQAINAADAKKQKVFTQEYGNSILFDYSYKYFYEDGYGKDYRILNLKEDDKNYRRKYLTANLISFYQQQLLYKDKNKDLRDFLLHKPLWVFVGGSVKAVRKDKVTKKQVSDVLEIIYFLTDFLKNSERSKADIKAIMENTAGLMDINGNSIFYGNFLYLEDLKQTAEQIFKGINELVFNNIALGANLYLDNLKGPMEN